MKSRLAEARRQAGYTESEFVELIQTQLPRMTENRLKKIATGRLRPTDDEKKLIARLLNCKIWEVFQ
jgi:transcriptional regulator with XRE-family HTH domain